MRLLLRTNRSRISIRYRWYSASLMPSWAYWPQRGVLFAFAFLKNAVTHTIKEYAWTAFLLVLVSLFGQHVSVNDFLNRFQNIWDIVLAVPVVVVIVLHSYNTATSKNGHDRVTYSRATEEEVSA